MSFSNFIKQIFADEDNPSSRQIRPRASSTAAASSEVDVFVERLNRALWNRRSILSGNIHLVGLQRIKDRLASEWDRVAERAQDVAQKVIQRHSKPDDIFTRYDELSFLIIFADMTPEQAQLKCIEIGEEIGKRLLGENFVAEAAEVKTGVFETDGSLIFSVVNKPDLMKRLLSDEDSSNEAAEGSTSGEAPGSADALPDQPEVTFEKLDRSQALASMRVMYRPMWNTRHKAIANYFAAASASNVFGEQLWDTLLRREFGDILSPAEFDVYVARSALRDMARTVAQGQRVLLCWPVHFETIAARVGRHAYIEICREIPESVRQMLIFELDGIPEGTPQSRLIELSSVLKPFCRAQILRTPWHFRQFGNIAGAGITAVGFDVSSAPRSDGERIRILEEFATAAAKSGLRIYVHGIASRPQALAALTAGYEWIDGEAVTEPTAKPGPMLRFNISDLYRNV